MNPWLLLQLADGGFPAGAFAHSSGLEAALVLGAVTALEPFLDTSLRQAGRAALPFVRDAATMPARLAALDDLYDATLPMEVPNGASRAQGRAFVGAAARIWAGPLGDVARYRGPAHHAPVFGAVLGTLGLAPEDAVVAYLHAAARGILSAAVRLGMLGPLEAQRLHAERAALLEDIVAAARDIPPEEAAQTAPLLEIYSALHHRLDGRMFQS